VGWAGGRAAGEIAERREERAHLDHGERIRRFTVVDADPVDLDHDANALDQQGARPVLFVVLRQSLEDQTFELRLFGVSQ
jgi:hypothetical protein